MAVTKVHPIKSTLKKAIDYICNPQKTDEKILISSYNCAPETADIEFEFTHKLARQQGDNLAHHLIQSFVPGEVTPEQAHEIGRQLADEVLKGKYEYVLTTHIDKGHIHNHIIFNAVDMVNNLKYNSNKGSYYSIRRASDRLCMENGLDVILNPKHKGKSAGEWHASKAGRSWKAILQETIDKNIQKVKTFDDFINVMENEGYEVKKGEYISFRAVGQERFTRSKTLGIEYTEEVLRRKIDEAQRPPEKKKAKIYESNENIIQRLVNMESSMKADDRGLEHWYAIRDIKEAANTLNFLNRNNLNSYSELVSKTDELMAQKKIALEEIKPLEKRMQEIALVIKHAGIYNRLHPIATAYNHALFKDKYRKEHESELILFEASAEWLKQNNIIKTPDLKELRKQYKEFAKRKENVYDLYSNLKKETLNYQNAKNNLENIMGILPNSKNKDEPTK